MDMFILFKHKVVGLMFYSPCLYVYRYGCEIVNDIESNTMNEGERHVEVGLY